MTLLKSVRPKGYVTQQQLLAYAIVFVAMVVSATWALATHSANVDSERRAQTNYENQVHQIIGSRTGCGRAVADRLDDVERDYDNSISWHFAAKARAKDGDERVAKHYRTNSKNDLDRVKRTIGPNWFTEYVDVAGPPYSGSILAAQLHALIDNGEEGGRLVNCNKAFPLPDRPKGVKQIPIKTPPPVPQR